MSSNLFKSGNIIKNDEARVIDSNDIIAERLQMLAEVMNNDLQAADEEVFYEGDYEGLDPEQLSQLLSDPDAEGFAEGLNAEQVQTVDTAYIEQMVEDARAQAEQILSDANAQAESIINSAQNDAQNIFEDAKAKGRNEGYQAGFDEGMAATESKMQEVDARREELENEYRDLKAELEPMFIDKLTDIYEHIFLVDLSDRKELVKHLLVDCMHNIEGGKNYFVHVSKDDFHYVSAHREELTQGLPGTSSLEIIEDISLKKAQCFIEADSGIFDCGLGTELSLLKKELSLIAYKAD